MKSTTATCTTTRKNSTPRLILKTTYSNATTTNSSPMTTTSMTLTSSPITTTGSFYLPPIPLSPQRQNKKGRLIHKHLRKPQAFDTYLRTTEPVKVNLKVNNYYDSSKRSSSLSSSCSSTSSDDSGRYPNFTSEEMMCARKAVGHHQPRSRRGSSSTAKFVRFAGEFNDGSSITDSSSATNSGDDWDPLELYEDDEEECFFLAPQYPMP